MSDVEQKFEMLSPGVCHSVRRRRNPLQRVHHRLRPLRVGQHRLDGHLRWQRAGANTHFLVLIDPPIAFTISLL
jgi:hypothetical protein